MAFGTFHVDMPRAVTPSEALLVRLSRRRPRDWTLAAGLALALIFAIDVSTPVSYPYSLFYMLVIFGVGFSGRRRLIEAATGAGVALTLLGSALLHEGGTEGLPLINTVATVLALVASGTAVRMAAGHYARLFRREQAVEGVAAALKDAQHLLQMSGKLANLGGWQIDPETGALTLTDVLKTMLRLEVGEALDGAALLQRFSPDHAARLMALVQRAAAHGESFDTEIEIVSQRNEIRWLRAIGEAAVDSRSGRRVVQGALKDITEHKRVEGEMLARQEQLQLLQTAINRVDDMVLITDARADEPGPTLVYVNDAFERLTGYAREEVIGRSPRLLQGPRTQRRTLDRVRAAIETGQPVRAELINYTKAGAEYWVELEVMPLTRADGGMTHLVAIERDVTARKRQEESDRQQAQLTALSERLGNIGGWIATPAKNEIIWSAGARKLMEWDGEAVPELDRTLEFYEPAYRALAERAFRACIAEGIPFSVELEGFTGKGRPMWARVAGTPEMDEQGHVVRVLGVVQDISKRKAMELARLGQEMMLAERTAQLEAAQRIGNMGSWSYDHDRDRLTWTPQIYTIFGIGPGAFSHDFKGLLALVHPHDRQLLVTMRTAARHDMERLVTSFRVVRPDGEVRHVQQIAEPVPGEGGNVYAGTLQDVTRRVMDEAALRESEERFRLVTDVSADVIWDWNVPSGNIWWNDREPSRFGYGIEQGRMTIERWLAMIHPDDRAAVAASLRAAMDDGAAEWSGQYRVVKADGGAAHVSLLAKLVRGEDGVVSRVVGSINDVTEQRMLEEKLRSAQKLEVVGQLTGGIAHDFNNLLTVILGNAELLEEALDAQPALQALARMSRTAAERGGELTSRLLSFARRQPLDPRAVDIAALIGDMAPLMRRAIGAGIDFVTIFGAPLSAVKVDASQLENALLNLCLNARDAMPDGGRIVIEASDVTLDEGYCARHADVTPGDYVLVSVTDTGEGMDAATLAKAFEPFFTTKAAGKGSGLGLSMVYGFAKQSRGHVRLYSEAGHGVSVQLYLPRAAAMSVAVRQRDDGAVVGGAERILVVEDDAMVLDHASGLLTQLGYAVQCVGNGADAMAVLREGTPFDLLFTDVMMPGGMNGRQLADAARALRPGLPVLYTSGYAENAIVHNGQLDRGVHFLHKPYRKAELARKLRAALAAAASG